MSPPESGGNVDLATLATLVDLAVVAGGAYLDPDGVQRARAAMERGLQRLDAGSQHTVVALAGATGSGKSSLFNALAEMEIAEVGARRPLTRQPMACVWGEAGSHELLDWLDVPENRRLQRESVLDADRQATLHGLVLLDLPDHDSTEATHQVEVDRLVGQVDLLVWVVDPQKYADDALHSRYLQQLTDHDAVMLVVLNQIDRLGPDEAAACLRDLRRLLDADGLSSVALLPVSARTGDGVEQLRSVVADIVRQHTAMIDRSSADLTAIAHELRRGVSDYEPGNGAPPGADVLVDDLTAAAGVPAVLDAMSAEYRRRGWQFTRWPVFVWLRRLRPGTLDRLGTRVRHDDLLLVSAPSQPVSVSAQPAGVRLAVDATASATAAGLPPRWAAAVHDAVEQPEAELVATLNRSVASVDLQLAPPFRWRVMWLLQWLLALIAVAGAGWLLAVGVLLLAGRRLPEQTRLLGTPLSVIMCLGGLLLGAALALASRWSLARSAARRRDESEEHLRAEISGVADRYVLAPIAEILDRHRTVRLALDGELPVDARVPPAVTPVQAPHPDLDPVTEPDPVTQPGAADGYPEPHDASRPGLARAFVPEVDPRVDADLEADADLERDAEPEARAEPEAQAEPEARAESDTAPGTDTAPEAQAGAAAEPRPDETDREGGPEPTRLAV